MKIQTHLVRRHTTDLTLATGVIGDDIHNIGIKVLDHAFRNNGFKIVSLGVGVHQEFIDAAIETKADAIPVSYVSGHGRVLSEGFRQKCTESGLADILMYIASCRRKQCYMDD